MWVIKRSYLDFVCSLCSNMGSILSSTIQLLDNPLPQSALPQIIYDQAGMW